MPPPRARSSLFRLQRLLRGVLMTTRRLAAAALVLALLSPAAADAAIIVTTYTGYVVTGFDGADMFHVTDRDLANQQFTVTYRIDDSVAVSSSYVTSTQSNLEGGSVLSSVSPVSAVFTLNHVEIPVAGLRYGYARGLNIPDYVSSLSHTSGDYTLDNFGEHGLFVSARIFSQTYSHSDIPADYHTPYSQTAGGIYSGDGLFKSYGNDGVDHAYLTTEAELRVTGVTTSGAPEPASWALMILGFAGAGAVLRRRGGKLAPA